VRVRVMQSLNGRKLVAQPEMPGKNPEGHALLG
jgi:hypothetical protein